MNAIKVYFLDVLTHHYVDFKGRATRKQFWRWMLFYHLSVILLLLAVLLSNNNGAITALVLSYVLVSLLPCVAIAARRLHDSDKSAWWLLLPLIPFVGSIGNFVLLVFFLLPSTEGENRFGANN